MTSRDHGTDRGHEMSQTRIDEFLYEHGHGVLSIARADDAHGMPVSYGYDGDRLFLYLLQFGESSKKISFSTETDTACLTSYDVRGRSEWECVIASGPLAEVPESEFEYMDSVMDDNAWFPSFYPPDWPITDVRRTELVVESTTGRQADGADH